MDIFEIVCFEGKQIVIYSEMSIFIKISYKEVSKNSQKQLQHICLHFEIRVSNVLIGRGIVVFSAWLLIHIFSFLCLFF